MKKEEKNEIVAEVIVYEPIKPRLREVISSITYTLFCGICAYGFTDYALVVSHKIVDYIVATIACVALISGIYLSVANIRDYLKSK